MLLLVGSWRVAARRCAAAVGMRACTRRCRELHAASVHLPARRCSAGRCCWGPEGWLGCSGGLSRSCRRLHAGPGRRGSWRVPLGLSSICGVDWRSSRPELALQQPAQRNAAPPAGLEPPQPMERRRTRCPRPGLSCCAALRVLLLLLLLHWQLRATRRREWKWCCEAVARGELHARASRPHVAQLASRQSKMYLIT